MADRDPQLRTRRGYPAYDADYAAWLNAQVELLGAGRFEELDVENLIEEVGDLGRSEFSSFVSGIEIVLVHMLKWEHQPGRRTRGWVASIVEHRRRIARSLKANPSYRSRIPEAIEGAYDTAQAKAAGEADLPLDTFPAINPYDWDAITSRDYSYDA